MLVKNVDKYINSNNILLESFILNDVMQVDDFIEGAKKYGGATIKNGVAYCNYHNEVKEGIEVLEKNIVSVYIPSTIDVDKEMDYNEINARLETYRSILTTEGLEIVDEPKYTGAWIASNEEPVLDNIIAVTMNVTKKTIEGALNTCIKLAQKIKEEQKQEGVTIEVNNGIIIV